MKSVRRRLTYANVMSSIAVFLVVAGGSALAAGTLGKNTVGTKQLKNSAVTGAKIKKGAVTTSKIGAGAVGAAQINTAGLTVPNATKALSATTAGSATTATTATSATTATKAQVAAIAERPAVFARISEEGVVSDASGITQANVTHEPGSGFYCFSGLNPAPIGGVATIDYLEAGSEEVIQLGISAANCPAGTQAFVDPRRAGAPAAAGFYVVFY
jgi:hypothetical protein